MANCTGATGFGIGEVLFADYGTPSGDCNTGNLSQGSCTTPHLTEIVSGVCKGYAACAIECSARVGASQFMGCNITAMSDGAQHQHRRQQTKSVSLPDPCHGTRKTVALQVRCETGTGTTLSIRTATPANSIATTAVPLLGADPHVVTVTESGVVVWNGGQYVPGVDGVWSAAVVDGALLVHHGSGVYDFRRTESESGRTTL
jgi:hypothetical protein